MTWTRLDDSWTERQVFEALPYEVRWHYLSMIQFCSRNSRYDGVMRRVDAHRCSDVTDPAAAVTALSVAGLVEIRQDNTVRVALIEEHIPPPSMRDERRKERQRTEKRRSRLHHKNDHSECLPSHCPHVVSAEVSTDPGTGQDRTGRGELQDQEKRICAAVPRDAPSGTSPGRLEGRKEHRTSGTQPEQAVHVPSDDLSERARELWERGYDN